jgi:hypothetical protein
MKGAVSITLLFYCGAAPCAAWASHARPELVLENPRRTGVLPHGSQNPEPCAARHKREARDNTGYAEICRIPVAAKHVRHGRRQNREDQLQGLAELLPHRERRGRTDRHRRYRPAHHALRVRGWTKRVQGVRRGPWANPAKRPGSRAADIASGPLRKTRSAPTRRTTGRYASKSRGTCWRPPSRLNRSPASKNRLW